ncbi:translation elongation factor Ts [Candidatus Peregrinibacteria bacterium CG10_big_fil_rev_8_21_14_0_10_49_24]|nr:MAG: translation elongation factor Ts [Candidatus Peregrinibacteria bacterium CG11_big_fil_rev_8_21_14_0_20_49_14]PIR50651.1 MAG: translation elongation factor Ts [Candidatus Peregrinibacteria bacterium CG10_big_fil_rev_8_21_14_0_10_49_24]PJA67735.1 MAG: translation elongation factor Ts [Candidatus Peregrinibacteria bacterium CG_4_9_14_3_um_filter_49_12]
MTDISASLVASLRSRTGVSILECKKALEEANGDEEKAIELLRKRGIAQASKKAAREQSEGSVFAHEENGAAALVFLKCETDFVARDDNFKALGQELAETLCKEGTEAAQALAESKLPDAVQKLGENITLGEMHRIEAPTLGYYVHSNGKIGVLVGMDSGDTAVAKDVAMHAAAMNPEYVSPDDVTTEAVEGEKNIWKEQLAKEGKPAEIMEKIMLGKEKKFREESALLTQNFVKDPSITVEKHLNGATISGYVRISVG